MASINGRFEYSNIPIDKKILDLLNCSSIKLPNGSGCFGALNVQHHFHHFVRVFLCPHFILGETEKLMSSRGQCLHLHYHGVEPEPNLEEYVGRCLFATVVVVKTLLILQVKKLLARNVESSNLHERWTGLNMMKALAYKLTDSSSNKE